MSQFEHTIINKVQVTTNYLQIENPTQFKPWYSDSPQVHVQQAYKTSVRFYRYLYQLVGETYHWTDRLAWSDEELANYLQQDYITILVLYVQGTPAGYIELSTYCEEPGTEIVYFGLSPDYHGHGYGKHLLSVGVQRAFDDGAERVWLHTCTLDGPYALANYQARGFSLYKSTVQEQVLVDKKQA
jgi:ribosomal protein S18 acetylase RimI-like enzyme